MVTPLTADDKVNESALRQLTQYLIEAGVHGLFALGSQGEFWALTADEKRRVLEIVVEEARDRVPVYAGTAAICTPETIALTRMAESVGVDAVSVLTPFFVSPSQDELYVHYRATAESTCLPVLLYNNPARAGVHISPGLVSRLSEIDNVVGIKDSSGDLSLAAEYIRSTPDDFTVLMGRDTLILASLLYGCKGAIAATANVAPGLAVAIYERFQAGDLEGARQAQERLAPLRGAFRLGTFPVVAKEALTLLGIEAGPARAPVGPLSDEKRERLRGILDQVLLLDGRE
jgi:4-hydroxy-tetrahydrodipicolinate synthase